MANASVGFGAFSVSAYDPAMSFVEGSLNSYFDKKSEKRAYERQLQLMAKQYEYAQRYAENSPSWNVKGLRDAGLNPILAASNGLNLGSTVPSVPSVTSHKPTPSSSSGGIRYDPLTREQIKSQKLDNDLREDNLKTIKSENEVRRLKAEAEAQLLRPVPSTPYEGDGKSVTVHLPSASFKALQKGIADDYDLRSERYIRETTDAVFKYGLDVLKLLPLSRKTEIIKRIILNKGSKSPNSSGSREPYLRNAPSSSRIHKINEKGNDTVFQYD